MFYICELYLCSRTICCLKINNRELAGMLGFNEERRQKEQQMRFVAEAYSAPPDGSAARRLKAQQAQQAKQAQQSPGVDCRHAGQCC